MGIFLHAAKVFGALLFGLLMATPAAEGLTNKFLPAIPAGYHLLAYDDCGVENRQPHVVMTNCYLWTFATSDTDAGPKERSAVFGYQGIQTKYEDLDPGASYLLALTYASDHVYNRVQSLEANGVELHGPYALPKAKATRVIVPVPKSAIRNGALNLEWKIHGEVNATVSIIELWSDQPAKEYLHIVSVIGMPDSMEGQVLDKAYEPASNVWVRAFGVTKSNTNGVSMLTGADGRFSFGRDQIFSLDSGTVFGLSATRGDGWACRPVCSTNLFFDPVHYRPLPSETAGLQTNTLLLDGLWALDFTSTNNARSLPLRALNWRPFKVPGQWLQQGYDIPQARTAAVAREFVIPQTWAGQRIIVRFDAIHAGTHYWINGHKLGYGENLFTPVEWDITKFARPGETNRLDLEMKVATVSEALSYSSAYAFHNLGGIDRSVRLFAIPQNYIREFHLDAALNNDYRNGLLRLHLGLDGASSLENRLSIALELQDPGGKVVDLSPNETHVDNFTGQTVVNLEVPVSTPLQWSAEKPNLYHLAVKLRQAGELLETIERNVGFRTIEIRGTQFLINGRRVKLAGACHHEFDPLTGRADTARHAETDVRLLKEANLNLIRTSHYPPTAELLDAADRLGMYVELEAPFCWVGGALDNATNLFATLTPTSAMIDYHHSHPSVIIWSLANESHFNPQFLAAAKLCKELDPTRPTTFNHDMGGNNKTPTDLANVHYPPWPPDDVFKNDLRPLYFGEYFFPVCHEQTDVDIDPGLRELWGQGHAEPDSAFGKSCAAELSKPPLKPGLQPGGWSMIYHSDRLLGGSIWASHDDAFFFSATNHAGYAWHHGFWGLIDCWRRPKPEWWLARHIFSPVWLETRHVPFVAGAKTAQIPVENRYAFSDLSELKFDWRVGEHKGVMTPHVAPGTKGNLEIPLAGGISEGDQIHLRVTSSAGVIIDETCVQLGNRKSPPPPIPNSGAPNWAETDGKIVIKGNGFGMVLDRARGDFDAADPRHTCAVTSFPTLHVSRYDFGDLNGPKSPPYAVFPDANTRRVEAVEATAETNGLRLTVRERFENFAGSTSWLIDKDGHGAVRCDYAYSGPPMDTREAGIRLLLKENCDELSWRRWSEWGIFPEESVCRAEGTARAHRDRKLGESRWNERPAWPWSQDETSLGTADFRSVKFNVYEASLVSAGGDGISFHADADAHFRAALDQKGVAAHLLWRCSMGQASLKMGDRLRGAFALTLGVAARQ